VGIRARFHLDRWTVRCPMIWPRVAAQTAHFTQQRVLRAALTRRLDNAPDPPRLTHHHVSQRCQAGEGDLRGRRPRRRRRRPCPRGVDGQGRLYVYHWRIRPRWQFNSATSLLGGAAEVLMFPSRAWFSIFSASFIPCVPPSRRNAEVDARVRGRPFASTPLH
jgi:hypothetical protein